VFHLQVDTGTRRCLFGYSFALLSVSGAAGICLREEAGKDRTKREREGGCSGPFAFWTATIQHPGAITLTAGNQELLSKTERRRQLILAVPRRKRRLPAELLFVGVSGRHCLNSATQLRRFLLDFGQNLGTTHDTARSYG